MEKGREMKWDQLDPALRAQLEDHFRKVKELLVRSNISAIVLSDGQTFKGSPDD